MRILLLTILLLLNSAAFCQSLTIYCEDDKPLQYLDANGNVTGMAVELVREIQNRIGNTDEIIIVPWARGLKSLDSTPNTFLFSTTRTAERNPLYQWIGPIFETTFGLYGKKDSAIKITSLDEAKTLKGISVYRGDIRDQYLTKAGFLNLERVSDTITAFKMLMLDRVDLYAGSSTGIKNSAESAGYSLNDVKLVFALMHSQLYIAVSKDTNPQITAQWNTALANMKKDGTFGKIFKKYYPSLDLPGPEITNF